MALTTTPQGHGLGWRPQLPDHRDLKLALAPPEAVLPKKVDLRETDAANMPEIWDQGQLGSCTAHAVGASWFHAASKSGAKPVDPSRLFIYFQERSLEGDVDQDGGAEIRDGFKVIANIGVPPETDWPYRIEKFAETPPSLAVQDASGHKATKYMTVDCSASGFRQALAAGYCVSFGFTVYESFESEHVAQTGYAPTPAEGEKVLGGHAVVAVGYDDEEDWLIVRNSWGESWGDHGYFYLPYDFFKLGLISDCWACEAAS